MTLEDLAFDWDPNVPKPVEYVVDEISIGKAFVVEGCSAFDKTDAAVRLAARVAHLTRHTDDLPHPEIRRKVVYLTDNHERAIAALHRMYAAGDLEPDDIVSEWFRIYLADGEVNPKDLTFVHDHVTEHVYEDKRWPAKPLVVFDFEKSPHPYNAELMKVLNGIPR